MEGLGEPALGQAEAVRRLPHPLGHELLEIRGVADLGDVTAQGGELAVEDTFGVHVVKLPAGHMVLYPSTSLHQVRPVTRGARIASFFWIQSLVRDDADRTLLFDLDTAIQQVSAEAPDHPAAVQLAGVYHNLVRRWAEL